jgi:hypothetical protein
MPKKSFFKISFFALMVISLSVNGLSKEEIPVVTSAWASAPPRIDGLNQDWADVPLISQQYGVNIGFKNDEKYLYILFVFTDPKYLTSIESTGMTVYFNTEGVKKREHAINFRKMYLTSDQFINWMENNKGPLTEEQKKAYRANPSYVMFYCGIIGKGSKEITKAEESEKILPASFRIGSQQKTFIYEFAIPLEKATESAPGIGVQPGATLMLDFDWGGWSRELKEAVVSGLSAAATRAKDQRASDDLTGGGGDPSDVARMRMGDAPEMAAMRKRKPKQYDIWVNLKLAEKQ